jgi:hypothetical protein
MGMLGAVTVVLGVPDVARAFLKETTQQDNVPLTHRLFLPAPRDFSNLGFSASSQEVCHRTDRLFDNLILGYPSDIQLLLKDMYYNDRNLVPLKRSIEYGAQANWEGHFQRTGQEYFFKIDERLLDCPVILRWNKLHEIAGHIGQVAHCVKEIGAQAFIGEINAQNDWIKKFLEISVAPFEKVFLDGLPAKIIEEDISKIGDKAIEEEIFNDIKIRRSMSPHDYVRLQHRKDCPPRIDEIDIKKFCKHPAVMKFSPKWKTQFGLNKIN